MAQIWDFNNRNFWIFESYNNSSSLFIYFVYFACLFLVPSVFYQTYFYYLNRQPGSSPCTWLPIECPLKIIYFHCKPSLPANHSTDLSACQSVTNSGIFSACCPHTHLSCVYNEQVSSTLETLESYSAHIYKSFSHLCTSLRVGSELFSPFSQTTK